MVQCVILTFMLYTIMFNISTRLSVQLCPYEHIQHIYFYIVFEQTSCYPFVSSTDSIWYRPGASDLHGLLNNNTSKQNAHPSEQTYHESSSICKEPTTGCA